MEPTKDIIFQEGWTSEQEMLLLTGIQACGLGNWNEIAEVVKTKKPVECETHYFSTFVDPPMAPNPYEEIIPAAPLPPPSALDTSPRESRPSIAHEKNLAARGKNAHTFINVSIVICN